MESMSLFYPDRKSNKNFKLTDIETKQIASYRAQEKKLNDAWDQAVFKQNDTAGCLPEGAYSDLMDALEEKIGELNHQINHIIYFQDKELEYYLKNKLKQHVLCSINKEDQTFNIIIFHVNEIKKISRIFYELTRSPDLKVEFRPSENDPSNILPRHEDQISVTLSMAYRDKLLMALPEAQIGTINSVYLKGNTLEI